MNSSKAKLIMVFDLKPFRNIPFAFDLDLDFKYKPVNYTFDNVYISFHGIVFIALTVFPGSIFE